MHYLLSGFCSISTVGLIAALHSPLQSEVDHSREGICSLGIVMEATPFLWALLITIILSQAAEPIIQEYIYCKGLSFVREGSN